MTKKDSNPLMIYGSLCDGLYKLDMYDKASASHEDAMVASNSTSLSDIELWHARFGHLNFHSLVCLQRQNMVHEFPPMQVPVKHVCKGYMLGKWIDCLSKR